MDQSFSGTASTTTGQRLSCSPIGIPPLGHCVHIQQPRTRVSEPGLLYMNAESANQPYFSPFLSFLPCLPGSSCHTQLNLLMQEPRFTDYHCIREGKHSSHLAHKWIDRIIIGTIQIHGHPSIQSRKTRWQILDECWGGSAIIQQCEWSLARSYVIPGQAHFTTHRVDGLFGSRVGFEP